MVRMAGSALVNRFDVSMCPILSLDLVPDLGVAGDAQDVLGDLQRLVAAAALAFECGVRGKAFQRRIAAALSR